MEITINVRGLEGITVALEKIAMGQISIPQYMAERESTQSVQEQTQQVPQAQPMQQVQSVQQESQGVVPLQQVPPRQQEVVQQPIQQTPIQQTLAQTEMPITVQSYSMDQLAVAATQLIDAGRIAEIQQLLAQFGVQALTALPKEQYGAFATALRGMGAKI